jgi:quinol monooxygenase YgiN
MLGKEREAKRAGFRDDGCMTRVIVAGTIDFDGMDVVPIIAAARDLIAAAYEEAGCIHYCWTSEVLHPGRIRVFEEWESREALSAHLADAAYHNMSAHLAACGMTGADVHKYRIDTKEPVYDPDGRPRGDFFTI